jgi:DNA repair photolyase
METLLRRRLLYRSGLGFWAINHVQGCAHGCRYPCYAYLLAKRYGRVHDFGEWCRPRLVANALELLDRELASPRLRIARVHLCPTTDPFMFGQAAVASHSLRIVEGLNARRVRVSVLTKGELPPALGERPFLRDNTLGISLVSLDEEFRRRFEPGAAPYAARIACLRRLHEAGCRTLVHIEPYPTPNVVRQELLPLLESVAFVDELYFGGWNYSPLPGRWPDQADFYRQQAALVRAFCRERRIRARVS